LKLIPETKSYIWGGRKLKERFGKRTADGSDTIAESWELSVHPDGESRTGDGRKLSAVLTPKMLGKNAGGKLEILVKLIDAANDLSVQVHPGDSYAARAGSLGKREMWYIIDREPGAGIYCGFKREVGCDELKRALKEGTVLELLNFFEVNPGDSFFIEAGVVHAIGKGVTLYEIQQSSNLTYRLYDYGRVGAHGELRPLHIEDALIVAGYGKWDKANQNTIEARRVMPNIPVRICRCESFAAYELTVDGECQLAGDEGSFAALTVIEGSPEIVYKADCRNTSFLAIMGDTYFVPAGVNINIKGNCKIIIGKV